MNFLSDFGIQPVLLAAQVVNFLILLFILKRFLYKPILKALEARKEKVAQSLKNAQEIEDRLAKLSEEEEKRLMKAALEGEKIIKQAKDSGVIVIEEAKLKAETLAQRIVEEARGQLEIEKAKLQEEMRAHMAQFVALGLEKITSKIISKKDQKDIIEKSVRELS